MTSPDNVGGLPELPEPAHHIKDRRFACKHKAVYTADQMRAYGMRCSVASAIETRCADESKRLGELCRAAPAGGNPARGKIDPSWSLFDRVDFALRDAGFDLDEAANIAALAAGSAPAGSGEVTGWRMDGDLRVFTVKAGTPGVADQEFVRRDSYSSLEAKVANVVGAAEKLISADPNFPVTFASAKKKLGRSISLLRKLQQGAE